MDKLVEVTLIFRLAAERGFIMTNNSATEIKGTCGNDFIDVREAFIQNFAERDEIGAAVSVYKEGVKVVDLWAGFADLDYGQAWLEDTIVCMMSVGKSMAALCLLRLVDRGAVDLESPVAKYWPEFAQAGKDEITIRQILAGQAGLMYADHAPDGSILD